ncbi:uncharacterized protein LOC126667787 isoform X2 [Mercurialis annua]|uniref:uncharacterized protein LOC126667787 isoform X2 n=1 Tax=Mercurialis annua TaxID=3986 RepID=UPI0024ADAA86|nr:uncharacterized protein LOC126667787 isoform X2 [Mercurialis annua]
MIIIQNLPINIAPNCHQMSPWPCRWRTTAHFLKPLNCAPLQQQLLQEIHQDDSGIMCDPCGGRGWLLCDFCQGQKTNVKADNKRIYRRCPSCRAITMMATIRPPEPTYTVNVIIFAQSSASSAHSSSNAEFGSTPMDAVHA